MFSGNVPWRGAANRIMKEGKEIDSVISAERNFPNLVNGGESKEQKNRYA